MTYEQSFLISLLISLVIEIPIVFLLAKYIYKKIDKGGIIFASVIASVLTLPYLWFVLPAYLSGDRLIFIICGELAVIIIETFIYYKLLKLKVRQAFIVSFVANLASALIGLL